MYARNPSGTSIRLPEHYSGCAFTREQPKPEPPPPPVPVLPKLGGHLPLPSGLGSEELLLLGLILLLARSEGENDLLWVLALLLFCG